MIKIVILRSSGNPTTNLIIYSVVSLGIGAISLFSGFKELKLKKLIEATPTYKVRSAAVGLGEITGKVVQAEELEESPFSHKECVYLKYTVEELRKSGKSSKWVKIIDFESPHKFYIEDDTGKMLVDPKGCDLRLERDYEIAIGGFTKATPELERFLNEKKIEYKTWFGLNRQFRFREYIIEPNDSLYILGTIDDNPYVEEGTAEKGYEDLMMQKGKIEKTYIISDKSEKQLIGGIGFWCWIKILGGAILIVLGIAGLTWVFGGGMSKNVTG